MLKSQSIEPIEARHRESLKELLRPFGLPPHIVEWKYFARTFGEGESRGLVWLREGTVHAAIGLIPFRIQTANGRMSASWTCDWVVGSPKANPGIGVLLMREASKIAGPLFSVGGNDVNRQLMPRIATRSIASAAVEYHRPLRLGGSRWFRGIDRRVGHRLQPLNRVRIHPPAFRRHAVVESGVSDVLAQFLEPEVRSRVTMAPAYDIAYLRWQIAECPDLESATCYVPTDDMVAAALCWRGRSAPRNWRCALWTRDESDQQTKTVLASLVAHVSRHGGDRLSIITAEKDDRRRRMLRSRGFVDSDEVRSLYVTGSELPAVDVAALSFLDSDLAYRFQ